MLSYEESDQVLLDLPYLFLITIFLQQEYASEGFYKELTLLGLYDNILSINEVGDNCKVCILTALKSAS